MAGRPRGGLSSAPVLVAGAGPTGLAAALELARRGLAVRIVEKTLERVPWSKALAVNPRTLELMEASGVTERLLAIGRKLQRMVVWEGETRRLTLRVDRMPHRYNFILSLQQARTEAVLEQALAERGVQVERGLEVLADVKAGQAPRFLVRGPAGDEAVPSGTLVFCAEGAHSGLRKALGIGFRGHRAPETFYLADALLDWRFGDTQLNVLITPDGPLPSIPLPDSQLLRLIGIEKDPLTLLPPDAKLREVAWTSSFFVSYRLADSFQVGDCYLAGDAAHIHSPVGGRGMNLGIEDACVFAALAAKGRLSEYAPARRPVAARVIGTTARFTRLVTITSPLLRFLRNQVVLRILDRAAVQGRVLKGLGGIDYPNPVAAIDAR